jgi:hypothetical protein
MRRTRVERSIGFIRSFRESECVKHRARGVSCAAPAAAGPARLGDVILCGLLGESDEEYDRAKKNERLRRTSRDHGRSGPGIEGGERKSLSECRGRVWLEDRRGRYVSVLTDRRLKLRGVGTVLTPIQGRVAGVVLARMRFRLRFIATRVGGAVRRLRGGRRFNSQAWAKQPGDGQEADEAKPKEGSRQVFAHPAKISRPVLHLQGTGLTPPRGCPLAASAGRREDAPGRSLMAASRQQAAERATRPPT